MWDNTQTSRNRRLLSSQPTPVLFRCFAEQLVFVKQIIAFNAKLIIELWEDVAIYSSSAMKETI